MRLTHHPRHSSSDSVVIAAAAMAAECRIDRPVHARHRDLGSPLLARQQLPVSVEQDHRRIKLDLERLLHRARAVLVGKQHGIIDPQILDRLARAGLPVLERSLLFRRRCRRPETACRPASPEARPGGGSRSGRERTSFPRSREESRRRRCRAARPSCRRGRAAENRRAGVRWDRSGRRSALPHRRSAVVIRPSSRDRAGLGRGGRAG